MDSRLKNLREMMALTQAELADDLGISRQSLISLERGKCRPSIDLAKEISDFFEMPIELIFYPKEYQNKEEPHFTPAFGGASRGKGENMAKKEKRELAPWSGFTPFRELTRMHEEIDRMFEDSFFKEKNSPVTSPAIDVIDKRNSLSIQADLPGVEEKDIEIEVHEDYVKIEGEKKESKEIKKDDYYHKESNYGSFSRLVSLPTKVKPNGAKAEMKNGRLEIIIPKLELKEGNVKKLKLGR